MSAVFYVYEHWRPDINQCFYVGKGKNVRGNYVGSNRTDAHKAIIAYLSAIGLCVEVRLFRGALTEEQAFDIERARIDHYRSIGIDLINVYGTPEYSRILRQSVLRGAKHPMYGKPISDEHRAKLRKAHLGKKRGPHTENTKRKQREAANARWLRPGEKEKFAAAHRGRKRKLIAGKSTEFPTVLPMRLNS